MRFGSASIEESWRCVDEVTLGHVIIRLDRAFNVTAMNADSNTHKHVLWTLSNLAINTEKVGALECLEAKVLVVEVALIDDRRVEEVGIIANGFVRSLRNHTGGLAVLRVYYDGVKRLHRIRWRDAHHSCTNR